MAEDVIQLFDESKGDIAMILTIALPGDDDTTITGSITLDDLDRPIKDLHTLIDDMVKAAAKLRKFTKAKSPPAPPKTPPKSSIVLATAADIPPVPSEAVVEEESSNPISQYLNKQNPQPQERAGGQEKPQRFQTTTPQLRTYVVKKGGEQVPADQITDDDVESEQTQNSGDADLGIEEVDDSSDSPYNEDAFGDEEDVQPPPVQSQSSNRKSPVRPIAPAAPATGDNSKLDFKSTQKRFQAHTKTTVGKVSGPLGIEIPVPTRIVDPTGTTQIKIRKTSDGELQKRFKDSAVDFND